MAIKKLKVYAPYYYSGGDGRGPRVTLGYFLSEKLAIASGRGRGGWGSDATIEVVDAMLLEGRYFRVSSELEIDDSPEKLERERKKKELLARLTDEEKALLDLDV